jgi:hypothetical protein
MEEFKHHKSVIYELENLGLTNDEIKELKIFDPLADGYCWAYSLIASVNNKLHRDAFEEIE